MGTLVKYMDRKNTDCDKWDGLKNRFGSDDLLAMWVADMDFAVPECVTTAMQKYLSTEIFGYYRIPQAYYDAIIAWEKNYHGFDIRQEWLRYSPNVVTAIYWSLTILSQPGDSALVLTPVYYPFMNAIRDCGRKLICSEMVCNDGVYSVDFDRFERDIRENDVKVFVLCSPHNPVGRVWKREELENMLRICRKYGVRVISDEIHHDLVFAGNRHISTASIPGYEDMVIMLAAPSKTFNMAGSQNSFLVIPNEQTRADFDKFVKSIHVTVGNAFGYVAAQAAYRGGRPWLDEVLDIIYGNYLYLRDTLQAALPKAVISPLEGTYLSWVDLSAYIKPENMVDFMENRCKIAADYGNWFAPEGFGSHVRLNLATRREIVEEAVRRMIGQLKD